MGRGERKGCIACAQYALWRVTWSVQHRLGQDLSCLCHGANTLGGTLSKQRLSHWLCVGIEMACEAVGHPLPRGESRLHSGSSGLYCSLQRNRSRGYLCSCVLVDTSPLIRFYLLDMSLNVLAQSVLREGLELRKIDAGLRGMVPFRSVSLFL